MKQSSSTSVFYIIVAFTAGIIGFQDATLASALLTPSQQYFGPTSSNGYSTSKATQPTSQSSYLIGSNAKTSETSSSSALMMTSVARPMTLKNETDDGSATTSAAPTPTPAEPLQQQVVPTTTGNMELVDQLKLDSEVIFSIFDVDGTGSISEKEFSNSLRPIGYSDTFVEKLFGAMDTDGDGVISLQEFRTLYLAVPSLRTLPGFGQDLSVPDGEQDNDNKEKQDDNSVNFDELLAAANEVFEAADKDGSGSIDASELKSHLSRWRSDRKTTPFFYSAVNKIFDLLDANGDQSISKEEFQDAYVRYSALRQALE